MLARRERINVRPTIRTFLRQLNVKNPAYVVQNIAFELARRSERTVPARWLKRLSQSLGLVAEPRPFEPNLFTSWPTAIWNEASLLGEVLALARGAVSEPRSSRAGRSSEGSVYTPAAIARAMIQEAHVGPRRVVDPACGAGVFLLEAFERAFLRRLESGQTQEQAARHAFCHEITGVDVDAEALAVAEFSLRLHALRLSGLSDDVPLDLQQADALLPLPSLDGQCECIVGNPPFVEGRGLATAHVALLRERFNVASTGKVNLFAVFVERAFELLKDDGVLTLILPATFQRNSRYKALRELLLRNTIESIKPLEASIFEDRAVETVVLRARKRPPARGWRVELRDGRLPQTQLPIGPVLRFSDPLPTTLRKQIDRMERHGVPLSDCCEIRDGISTGFQPFPLRLLGRRDGDAFVAQDGTRIPFNPAIHKKVIDGCEFSAHSPIEWQGRYIEYDKTHEHTPPHPGRAFNCQLRDASIYDRAEKIVTRQTARGLIATLDRQRYFVRNSVHATYTRPAHAQLSMNALCAAMNSTFYSNYLLALTGETGDVFPQVHIADLKRIPILPGLLRVDGALDRLGAQLLEMHTASRRDAGAIEAAKSDVESILQSAFGC